MTKNKKLRAVVIPADGTRPAELVEEDLNLRYLQGVVGGMIEAVNIERVLTDEGMRDVDATVFVNEEGKLIGLPVNHRATDLCAVTIGGWFRDVVMGDVIVVGPPGPQGQETACPQNVIDIIRNWGWFA